MAQIVVVDDDRSTSRLLRLFLDMDGFDVIESPRPQDVVEQARTAGADAFVIDCHLGTFNGLELVRTIRTDLELRDAVIVVTSGKQMDQEAAAAGADLFLLKPFSPSVLSAKLSELLAVV